MRNDLWTIDKTLIERLRAHTCTYECVRLWMYEDVSTGTLTATLPLIWTTGRGESRKRFDDFDGLVRTADWLPPTSRQTFDEIQTFGPIPLAGCVVTGVREMAQFTPPPPWTRCGFRKMGVRSARSENSTIDAPVDPISGPGFYTRSKSVRGDRSNTIGFRDRGSFTTNAVEFIFMIRTVNFWKKFWS